MPLLAGLVLGLFKSLADFFVNHLTKKLAYAAAAVGVFGVLTAALFAGLSLLLNGLSAALPDWPGMEWAIYMAVPPAVPASVAAVIAADAAVALYRWNVENMRLLAYIT